MRLLCALALAALLAFLVWRLMVRRSDKTTSAARLKRTITKMTHDPAVAERLIARERQRHPELSQRALLRKVIRQLERDQRR